VYCEALRQRLATRNGGGCHRLWGWRRPGHLPKAGPGQGVALANPCSAPSGIGLSIADCGFGIADWSVVRKLAARTRSTRTDSAPADFRPTPKQCRRTGNHAPPVPPEHSGLFKRVTHPRPMVPRVRSELLASVCRLPPGRRIRGRWRRSATVCREIRLTSARVVRRGCEPMTAVTISQADWAVRRAPARPGRKQSSRRRTAEKAQVRSDDHLLLTRLLQEASDKLCLRPRTMPWNHPNL
jgi:hypothetical protein